MLTGKLVSFEILLATISSMTGASLSNTVLTLRVNVFEHSLHGNGREAAVLSARSAMI